MFSIFSSWTAWGVLKTIFSNRLGRIIVASLVAVASFKTWLYLHDKQVVRKTEQKITERTTNAVKNRVKRTKKAHAARVRTDDDVARVLREAVAGRGDK